MRALKPMTSFSYCLLHALVAQQPHACARLGSSAQVTMPPSPLVMFFVG